MSDDIVRYQPGQLGRFDENRHDWNTVQAEAIGLGGADLLGKEMVDFMVRVPHTIVGISFYQGKAMENGHEGAFASFTALVAPEDILSRRFRGNDKVADWKDLPFDPDDVVLYNDGGTGAYRQAVKVLHDNGFIGLPDPVIEGGKSGESTYDLHPKYWTGVDTKRVHLTIGDGGWGADSNIRSIDAHVRISAPRGIRYSDYNGPTGEAKTRYIG